MKVLVLTTTFPRWKDDSTPVFVHELSRRLGNHGLEIIVLAPHHEGAKFYEELEGLKIYRFPYFYPFKYQRLCYNGGMLSNFKKSHLAKIQLPLVILSFIYHTFKLAISEKINLIHAHWIIPSGFVCGIVKPVLRKPLIVSVHGSDIALIKQPFFKHFGKHILRNADVCTVNSTATRDSVLEVLKSGKEPRIIPMGVDLGLFKPFPGHVDKNSSKNPVILTVGRLDKNKGISYLVDAMPKVINKFQGAKLIIAGDGPEKGNLTDQIKNLNLEENVTLAGAVKNKDLPEFYNIADLFVLPSFREGLGVVLLEAMACGTPVIGSQTGGIPDIIINGENGIFIKPGDPDDIAEKIILCLSDKALLTRFSANGLRTVTERFSWGSIAERFSNEYTSFQIN